MVGGGAFQGIAGDVVAPRGGFRAGVAQQALHVAQWDAALSESVPTGRDGLFVSTATPMARARVVRSWKPKSPPVLLCARGSVPVCDFPHIRIEDRP